jgi:ABC-type transport system involved in cytochrome bd biosynthesis fused ATPase/permease subunit
MRQKWHVRNSTSMGRTTLIIAHRLSTIMHADKIVAMQDGRIVEVGTHAELMGNHSVYYNLYKAQFEHALSMDTGLLDDISEEQDRLNRV